MNGSFAACAFAEVGRRRRTRGAPAPDVQREPVARGREVPQPPHAASPQWGSPRRRGGGGCPYRASSLRRPSIADLEPRAATMRLCPHMGLRLDWSFASVANRRKQESRGSNGCPKTFFSERARPFASMQRAVGLFSIHHMILSRFSVNHH